IRTPKVLSWLVARPVCADEIAVPTKPDPTEAATTGTDICFSHSRLDNPPLFLVIPIFSSASRLSQVASTAFTNSNFLFDLYGFKAMISANGQCCSPPGVPDGGIVVTDTNLMARLKYPANREFLQASVYHPHLVRPSAPLLPCIRCRNFPCPEAPEWSGQRH